MSQVQQLGKQTMRAVKNYTKGYTDTQTMVREATSSDPWGPSGTQMNEISQLTYNQQDFIEVMEMIDKRLNDKGKNWRHVFKSLTLVDYLLHAGSENVVKYFKENLYIVKTLREFVYVDDEGKDQGANVRQKAKDITSLLMDPDRMAEARKGRASMRDRMAGNYSPPPMAPPPSSSSSSTRPRSRTTGSRPTRNEDEDLQKAIEESKRLAEQQKSGEDDLQRAIRMSQEEDERRKAELARNPNGGLFDSTQQQQQQKPSDQLIDFDSNPSMMQPQPPGMMPQYTGMPNMHQFNSYNPFAAQQQAAQEEYMRMLEQQRQMEQQQQYQQMLQQQQYQQQQQTQQQQFLMAQPTGMPMQPQHTAQPMMAQPTGFGSNNPFAAFSQPQQPQQDMSSSSLAPPQQQSPPQPQPERPASQPAANSSPSNAFPKRNNANDERHAELAAMLGGGGPGIDTYGNVGNMRVPIGSAFHPSNRTQAQPTGMQPQATGNPFQRSASQPPQQQQQDQPFFSL